MIAALLLAASLSMDSSAAPSQRAIERALPFLAREGDLWIEKNGCVSCHHTGFLIWSHVEASRAGVAVDAARLKTWTDWAFRQQLTPGDDGVAPGSRNLEGIGQLILGRDRGSALIASRREDVERFAEFIAAGEQPDGTWKPGGQLPSQKRPAPETTDVSGAWALLALLDDGVTSAGSEAAGSMRSRAVAFLDGGPAQGVSTEWWAVRLLLARRLDDAARGARLVEALLARQNADGGWSWVEGDPSDALGTGQALYALVEAGVSRSHDSLRRAREYLLRTQQTDGSWSVKSTKKAKRAEALPTSVFLGTAWAVMGLARSLPERAAWF